MRNYPTKFYEYKDEKRNCTVVKATTTYAGKAISAVASTSPTDTHDFETGKKIASLRLDIKIAEKREKSMKTRAARYTALIAQYNDKIRMMKKEVERALVAAGDRKVEGAEYSAQLNALLDSLN